MERLTYDFAIGGNHCWQVKGADNRECRQVCEEQEENGCKGCPIALAFDRLAAYEDTGLAPEEVQIQKEAMESMGWFGKMFQRYKGDPRGPIGTLGTALGKSLVVLNVESAKNRQPVKDVDGNTWLPMLLDEFESMADIIEHGQEWIPVKVRLPEKSGEYLILTDEKEIYTLEFEEDVGDKGEFGWWTQKYSKEGWAGSDWSPADDITHWMPLPSPPKEEKK